MKHVVDLAEVEEHLKDSFARWHHDTEVCVSRAAAITALIASIATVLPEAGA